MPPRTTGRYAVVKAKKEGGDEEGKKRRRNHENSALSRKQEIKWYHGPFKTISLDCL